MAGRNPMDFDLKTINIQGHGVPYHAFFLRRRRPIPIPNSTTAVTDPTAGPPRAAVISRPDRAIEDKKDKKPKEMLPFGMGPALFAIIAFIFFFIIRKRKE